MPTAVDEEEKGDEDSEMLGVRDGQRFLDRKPFQTYLEEICSKPFDDLTYSQTVLHHFALDGITISAILAFLSRRIDALDLSLTAALEKVSECLLFSSENSEQTSELFC